MKKPPITGGLCDKFTIQTKEYLDRILIGWPTTGKIKVVDQHLRCPIVRCIISMTNENIAAAIFIDTLSARANPSGITTV